jgi:hypothetical protein
MAVITKVKCDRCGHEQVDDPKLPVLAPTTIHISSAAPKSTTLDVELDLCTDCYTDLMSRTKSFLNVEE